MSFDLKKFFIVDVNEEGSAYGFMTNNLHKDFIEKYKITWHEYEDNDDFEPPAIEDIQVGNTNRMIYIFSMNEGPMRPDIDIRSNIGEFNLFTSGYQDDLIDFIQGNWRSIESGIDESNSVKKFKDFV
jgi:hypothetical protein